MHRQVRWKVWALILPAVLVLGTVYYYGAIQEEKERAPAVYSVILYQYTDNAWTALTDGIEQAEEDFGVKVNYRMMDEEDDYMAQADILREEIQAGTDGILLAPVDTEGISGELHRLEEQVPVITVETSAQGQELANISADNYEMGYTLGEKILEDMEQDGAGQEEREVTVVEEFLERDSVSRRYEGLVDALESGEQEVRIRPVSRQEGDFSLQLFIGTVLDESAPYLAALDKFSTEEAAAAWKANRASYEAQGKEFKIYGIGNTAQIVNDLDNGNLWALVYQNEFNMGYLGIQALVEKEKKGWIDGEFAIHSKLVTRETLYEAENERLLFPSI